MILHMKKFLLSILLLVLAVSPVLAEDVQETKLKGEVTAVNIVDCDEGLGDEYICYTYDVYIKDTKESVQTMVSILQSSGESFKVGDAIYLTGMQDLDGNDTWSITSYARNGSILFWLGIFIILVFLIGGKKSLGSILSLFLSFLVLYIFIIPQIINSGNVIWVGYIGVFIILTLGMYLAHGFKKQTTIALVSTYIGVGIVSVLVLVLMESLHINGMGEETAFLLSSQIGESLDIQKLFFISIIISAIGVLDDVAIGQVSAMYEIYTVDTSIGGKELYRKTMNVGKEHVASMINTLFIVYAGSSLSLVMLMYLSNRDIGTLVSIDMISEEIVRTLAISIALLLVVPISTYISAGFLCKGE